MSNQQCRSRCSGRNYADSGNTIIPLPAWLDWEPERWFASSVGWLAGWRSGRDVDIKLKASAEHGRHGDGKVWVWMEHSVV